MRVTAEEFGEAIIRASILEASNMIKAGKVSSGTQFEIPARVFIRVIVDPNSIDVKFEECMSIGQQTALQCYIEAHAPRPSLR